MPQILADQIPADFQLTADQAAALEGVTRMEIYNRMKPGDAHEVTWAVLETRNSKFENSPGPKRRRVIDGRSLTPGVRQKHLSSILSRQFSAPESKIANRKSQIEDRPRGQLPMFAADPDDQAIEEIKRDPMYTTVSGVAIQRYRVVQQMLNHDWRAAQFSSKAEFLRSLARSNGTNVRKLERWRGWWKEKNDLRDLVDDKPGPGKGFNSSLDEDMKAQLIDYHLIRHKTARESTEMLAAYLATKQNGCGVDHAYRAPSYGAVKAFLREYKRTHRVETTLALGGEKEFLDRCGRYLSRRPPDFVNAVWVTDQRLHNVRLRDGGERLGRIWSVNFIDVCSWKWLGCWFGPILSSDMVMSAAAMAITRYGVPDAVHHDQGKEFKGTAFNGSFVKIKGETVFREVSGLWQRLNVRPIGAIGENPKSKIIERWHAVVDGFDRRFITANGLAGWTGGNPDERPDETAELEAEHERWVKTGAGGSRLLTLRKYVEMFVEWCETEWNAAHRGQGKYLRGMTPNEAWNTRRPAATAERPDGLRRLTDAELEFETADRRLETVGRGGQVNVKIYGRTIEFQHPALFQGRQGQKVLVLLSRRSLRSVGVYDAQSNELICEAQRKRQFEWIPENRDELRAAIRCDAAMHRAVRKGLEAQRQLSVVSYQSSVVSSQSEGHSREGGNPSLPEISGVEFTGRRMGLRKNAAAPPTMTSQDVAREFVRLEREGE